jgi:hypothetical protein
VLKNADSMNFSYAYNNAVESRPEFYINLQTDESILPDKKAQDLEEIKENYRNNYQINHPVQRQLNFQNPMFRMLEDTEEDFSYFTSRHNSHAIDKQREVEGLEDSSEIHDERVEDRKRPDSYISEDSQDLPNHTLPKVTVGKAARPVKIKRSNFRRFVQCLLRVMV